MVDHLDLIEIDSWRRHERRGATDVEQGHDDEKLDALAATDPDAWSNGECGAVDVLVGRPDALSV